MIDTFDYHSVPPPVAKAYLQYLNRHIEFVQLAGAKLLVPDAQLDAHDHSKFGKDQFYGYAMQFFGGGAPHEFAMAWLSHQNTEKHHWEYWILRSDHVAAKSGAENGILPMPHVYAREMVADWMSASKTYTGSWDMTKWLLDNIPKIKIHSSTRTLLRSILAEIGYDHVLKEVNFFNEDRRMA